MSKITKKDKILIIGRFQPFHLGHLHVLKDALRDYDVINIVIGSSQEDYTMENPLTSGERLEMLKKVMSSLGLKSNKYKIVLTSDIPTNSAWPKYIASKVGRFDEVLTANPLTKMLFEDSGYGVVEHPLYRRKIYSGTEIRERILKNKKWDFLVPVEVMVYLRKIGFEDRLNKIARSDNPYT